MDLAQAVSVLDALLHEDWQRFNECVPVDYWLAVLPNHESLEVSSDLSALDKLDIRLEISGKLHRRDTAELKPLIDRYLGDKVRAGQGVEALRELRNLIALLNGLANQIESEV